MLIDLLMRIDVNYVQKECHHQDSSYLEVVSHFCILFALHCVCMCDCQCMCFMFPGLLTSNISPVYFSLYYKRNLRLIKCVGTKFNITFSCQRY